MHLPYFRAKAEEYTVEIPQGFRQWMGDSDEVYQSFMDFIERLLDKTQQQNPFESHYSENENGTHSYLREWCVLFKSKLHTVCSVSLRGRTITLPKGQPFLLHLGMACFNQGESQHSVESFQAKGYLKLALMGSFLQEYSSIAYVQEDPFYTLPEGQLSSFQEVILLYLIALRLQFGVELGPLSKIIWWRR